MRAFSICIIFFFSVNVFSQEIKLNESFGNLGSVITNLNLSTTPVVKRIKIQTDGKILIGGSADITAGSSFNNKIFFIRYNSNGTLDQSFGNQGILQYTNVGYDLLIDFTFINNKLIAIFNSLAKPVIIRFNIDGSIDNSFGTSGKIKLSYYCPESALLFQNDGKILVGGYKNQIDTKYDYWLIRFDLDGNLDQTFGNSGEVLLDLGYKNNDFLSSLAIQSDNKIVVCGTTNRNLQNDFATARLNSNGSLDSTFGGQEQKGISFLNFSIEEGWSDIVLTDNNKILVTGAVNVDSIGKMNFAVSCYNSIGVLDSNFAENGLFQCWLSSQTSDRANKLFLQRDGKFLIMGNSQEIFANSRFAICRITSDGLLDTSFGTGGKYVSNFTANEFLTSSVLVDKKLFVAGNSGNNVITASYIVNLNSDVIEESKANRVISIYPNPASHYINIYSNFTDLGVFNVAIFNDMGFLCKSSILSNDFIIIEIEDLPQGIYFVCVSNSLFNYNFKLIK